MPRETELLSNPVFIGIDFTSRGFLFTLSASLRKGFLCSHARSVTRQNTHNLRFLFLNQENIKKSKVIITMAWNNAKRRVKFEANEARFAEKCRALGMSEEAIAEIYESDLREFNNTRRFY